jgi:PIN domain nuclease of toxin-antitoxin system
VTLLFDTHLLIWALISPRRLSIAANALLVDPNVTPAFSVASIWEVAIKSGKQGDRFAVDPAIFHGALRASGYAEIGITSEHALAVVKLPLLHGDPFDRILIAQAMVEDVALITSDRVVAAYGAPVRLV